MELAAFAVFSGSALYRSTGHAARAKRCSNALHSWSGLARSRSPLVLPGGSFQGHSDTAAKAPSVRRDVVLRHKAGGSANRERRQERLHRALSRAGICSRRAAERLIAEGQVSVNGATVGLAGPCLVDTSVDVVTVGGRNVSFRRPDPAWILLHKPKGYICTVNDERGRRTVMDLVRNSQAMSLVPVGRLDSQSTGLLILTNERDMVHELTHPSSLHVKEYIVRCEGHITEEKLARLRTGMLLEGDTRPTLPANVEIIDFEAHHSNSRKAAITVLDFRIREGRNRQIRRMCEAISNPVMSLKRVAYGPVRLDRGLRLGQSRALTPNEVKALRRGVGASANGLRRKASRVYSKAAGLEHSQC